MNGLTWLHLSDWKTQHTAGGRQTEEEPVTRTAPAPTLRDPWTN